VPAVVVSPWLTVAALALAQPDVAAAASTPADSDDPVGVVIVAHVGEGCGACGLLLDDLAERVARVVRGAGPAARPRVPIELVLVDHRWSDDAQTALEGVARWRELASVRTRDVIEVDDFPPVPEVGVYLVSRVEDPSCLIADIPWAPEVELRADLPTAMGWLRPGPGESLVCERGVRVWTSARTLAEVDASEQRLDQLLARVLAPEVTRAP